LKGIFMTFQIKTAAELVDPELEARWTTRRAARETRILQAILRTFVERPEPHRGGGLPPGLPGAKFGRYSSGPDEAGRG
jgi:hypothetical protein